MLVSALVIAAYCVFFVVSFVRAGPRNPFVYLYVILVFTMFLMGWEGGWPAELAAFILLLLVMGTTRRVSLFFFHVFNFFLGAPTSHLLGVPIYRYFTVPGTYAMNDYNVDECVSIVAAYCVVFMSIAAAVILVRKALRVFAGRAK